MGFYRFEHADETGHLVRYAVRVDEIAAVAMGNHAGTVYLRGGASFPIEKQEGKHLHDSLPTHVFPQEEIASIDD